MKQNIESPKTINMDSSVSHKSVLPNISNSYRKRNHLSKLSVDIEKNKKLEHLALPNPKIELESSLYEKLFLNNHVNTKAINESLKTINGNSEKDHNKQFDKRIKKEISTRPNMSYFLLGKKDIYRKYLPVDKSSLNNPEMKFSSKSEKERYFKTLIEFKSLKSKIQSDPNNSKIYAIAVNSIIIQFIDKYFGPECFQFNEEYLNRFIEFVLSDPIPINPQEIIPQIIINALLGNYSNENNMIDEHKAKLEGNLQSHLSRNERKPLPKLELIWTPNRNFNSLKPTTINRNKEFNEVLEKMLENSIGRNELNLIDKLSNKKDYLLKSEQVKLLKAKRNLEKSKLTLEHIYVI